MKFLPRCPKCDSPNTDMYRDRTVSVQSWPHDAVFHCRCCGHRLFGNTAVNYTDKLLVEHQEELRKAAEAAKKAAEEARKEAARRAAEEARKEAERKRREALVMVRTPPVCAWDPCSEPSRPNSMYCSRNCSNKNARARHKARLGGTVETLSSG